MLYAIHDFQYQKGNLQVWHCSLGSPPLLVLFGEWCSSHSGCFAPFLHCMHNQSWYILTDLVQPHSPSYTKDCSSVITIGSSGNSSLILKQCRSLMVSSLLKWKLVMVNDSQSQNKRSKACVLIAAIMLTVYKTAAGWAYTASFCQFGTLGITFNNWSLSGSRGIGLVSYNVLFMSKKKSLYLYLHYTCSKIWGKWGIRIIYPTKQALSVLFLDRGSFSRKISSQRILTLLRSPEVPASMSIS